MEAAAAPDEVKCRCFLATLEGSACDWFNRLPKGTIDEWDTLAEKFLTHFAANRRQRLPNSHLLNICIRKGEKVRDFIVQWEKEARDVHGADDQALVAMFQAALPLGEVRKKLHKNPPPTYQETLERAKFLASEEFDDALDSEAAPTKSALADSGEKKMQRLIARGPAPLYDGAAPSRGAPEGRTWRNPAEPVAVATQARNSNKRHIGRECDDLDDDEAQGYPVGFIHGGNIGGDSVAQRKRWKHMAFIAKVHQATVPKLGRREQIQFMEKDLPNTPSPHRDALVMQIEINVVIVHRTLVDMGSSVNVMYEKTFQDLGLNRKDLRPVRTSLSGFTGDSIEAEGVITVPVIVGDGAHKAKLKMEFMVFPTPSGIGVAREDQKLARGNAEAGSTAEEVEEVPLDPLVPERKVKIKASLNGNLRKHLVDVLTAFRVIYAWGPGDMPGVHPKIICHRLAVNLKSRPVKQKKRFLSSERREFVAKEVATLQGYEALLCGLGLAVGMNATKLRVKCDSKLVVGHVSEEFEAKDERMKKYRDAALELLESFTAYSVEQIPQAENGTLLSVTKGNPPRIFLANNCEGLHGIREEMQGLPRVLEGTWEAVHKLYPPSAQPSRSSSGGGPHRRSPQRYREREIRHSGNRLLHQMGGGSPVGEHNGSPVSKVPCQASHLPVWCPQQVITDNGTQFKSKPFNNFLENWGIKHSYASVGYPLMNGQVENANRTIIDGLKRKLEACGGSGRKSYLTFYGPTRPHLGGQPARLPSLCVLRVRELFPSGGGAQIGMGPRSPLSIQERACGSRSLERNLGLSPERPARIQNDARPRTEKTLENRVEED
ncbi:unnamed protein product [Cuscuta campestris]|uniref:Integrase catalytic domain-containing protein n=1 Tax=Cuscuta campestris TaxID=132261 RepID=A0A484M262_9ASTE|nr:unnamed protein product [Cuscuta campestris]